MTLTAERPSHSFEIALGVDGPSDPVGTVGTVPGAVQIDSRPSGAQVWMDGALIGTTPLLVSGVDSGSHAVRIELPGYRLWTTSVEVTRGERARVAASLER